MATSFYGGAFFGGEFFSPPTAVGGRPRRRRREVFKVRYKGLEYEALSVEEMQYLVAQLQARAREELAQLPPKQARRAAKRPAVKIEVPEQKALQQELYRHDLPDIAPMIQAFDFDALRSVIERLEAIRAQLDEDDDEELLTIL